jgi:aspartate/methionine/tyrosine aminotransferase
MNSNVTRTMASPISEAYSWLADLGDVPDLIDVSQAVPGYLPAPELIEHLASSLPQPALSRYGSVLGQREVREAFAADSSDAYESDISPDQVAITAGCNQAFCLATSVICAPGDELIIPVPYYFNHDMWLTIQGIVPRYLSCGDDMVPTVEDAESLVGERTRAILLVTPNNPTGTVYPPATIRAFYELARRRGIKLILDETYRDFRPTTEPAHDLFGSDWEPTVIHLYSFSKVFSITGYRVGALIAAADFLTQVDKVADCIAICAPQIGQEAARFGMAHLGDWVEANRLTMNRRVETFRTEMSAVGTGYEVVASGAYFAYVRHPDGDATGRMVARRLLEEQHVLSLAGEMFGPGQEPYLRLAFANLDDERIPELVARLAARR